MSAANCSILYSSSSLDVFLEQPDSVECVVDPWSGLDEELVEGELYVHCERLLHVTCAGVLLSVKPRCQCSRADTDL